MDTILQRVCWNTRGWRMPAGSVYEAGFPSEEGFGHEEWNFQLEDTYDGQIYGYTYSRPSAARIESSGGRFRVVFFGIHPLTREPLIAGVYHSAELIPDDAYDELFEFYESSGIFERRARELAAVSSYSYSKALKEVRKAVSEGLLTFRCPVSEVQIFSSNPPLSRIAGNQKPPYLFTLFKYLHGNFPKNAVGRAIFEQGNAEPTGSALPEDAYYRESARNLKEIIPRHNKLSNAFCDWLSNQHGVNARQELQRVDVAFRLKGAAVLAELKVCYGVGTTKSIREALGQLLEYNHYPSRNPADAWLIVLDEEPLVDDRSFVDSLRERRSLPLTLGWQKTAGGFAFHPEWP